MIAQYDSQNMQLEMKLKQWRTQEFFRGVKQVQLRKQGEKAKIWGR
jgi:hypothetical protein